MEAWWITADDIRRLSPTDIGAVRHRDDGVLWVDFVHTDSAGLSLLTSLVNARPEDLQDCHNRSPVPKLHPYPDHHFSAINGLARGTDGRLYFQPLKVFLSTHLLVTVLGPSSAALTPEASHRELSAIRQRLDSVPRPRSGFELVAMIRFEMLHAHEMLVASVASSVAALERNVMQHDPVKAEALLEDLFGLRHDLQTIRTNTAQTHELYVHLIDVLSSSDGLMQIDLRRLNELRQGFSHLRNTSDLEREYLQEVLDLFQTRVSTELNRFVRKITAFGTIAIGWTVIAGVYGMNFTHMPELSWKYGYPMALGAMAVSGVLFVIFFRKRGWL